MACKEEGFGQEGHKCISVPGVSAGLDVLVLDDDRGEVRVLGGGDERGQVVALPAEDNVLAARLDNWLANGKGGVEANTKHANSVLIWVALCNLGQSIPVRCAKHCTIVLESHFIQALLLLLLLPSSACCCCCLGKA